jgi:hypothetical protein
MTRLGHQVAMARHDSIATMVGQEPTWHSWINEHPQIYTKHVFLSVKISLFCDTTNRSKIYHFNFLDNFALFAIFITFIMI